jgi:hypothetical protein
MWVDEGSTEMIRFTQHVVGLMVVLAARVAAAQMTPVPTMPQLSPEMAQRFKQADIEQKGGLTEKEAAGAGISEDHFNSIDSDHDGIVTLYELGTYFARRTSDWAKADTNGDGVVTREEAEKVPSLKAIFDKADKNGDGVLRKEEYEAFSETTLNQNVDLPYVVPNIINKKF